MSPRTETTSEALRAALAAERLRNTRLVNVGRFVGVLATLGIELTLEATQPNYLGSHLWLHGVWLAAAIALLLACRRSDTLTRYAALALPLLDMPLFFLLMSSVVAALQHTGFADDGRAVAAGVTVFFALMVLMSGALLERRLLIVSAATALALSLGLQIEAGVDLSQSAFMTASILLAFVISIAIGSRSVALVTAVTDEQLRRERLGRYFSPQIAERLLARGDDAGRGETRDVSVLFADLRDFTTIGEQMPGAGVVALLNEVHEALVSAIFEHGGTLDKYMGDGIMCYFGAPLEQPDHARRALDCAAAMQAALAALNTQRTRRGDVPLRLGIGVHSGSVVLGDIGAARRREFTVIGHTVNIAARLEQLTKELGVAVLTSAETAGRVGDGLRLTPVDTVAIRGQTEPMQVYGFRRPDTPLSRDPAGEDNA
jgi:class 3 adenylate cyclase